MQVLGYAASSQAGVGVASSVELHAECSWIPGSQTLNPEP